MEVLLAVVVMLGALLPLMQGARVYLVHRAAGQQEQREAVAAREQADLIKHYADKRERRKREQNDWNRQRWAIEQPHRDRARKERMQELEAQARRRAAGAACTCEYIAVQAICEPEPTYHLTSRNGCTIHTEGTP